MATWPASLPPLPAGVAYVPGDTRLRTSMDAGPDKVRTRFTAVPTDIPPVEMILTKAQVDTLETFFVTTTNEGTDTFTWDDPLSGSSSANFRFVDRPIYRAAITNPTASQRQWVASFSLEILP